MLEFLIKQVLFLQKNLTVNYHFNLQEGTLAEINLQKLWFEHFLPKKFKTIDGSIVFIEDTGFWNHQHGPDFINAKIRLDNGHSCTGDIELHIHAKDWFHHKHDKDPRFSNVILHVSLYGKEPILHVNKGAIKSVELFHQLDKTLVEIIQNLKLPVTKKSLPTASAGACSTYFLNFLAKKNYQVLKDAGLSRLFKKAILIRRQRLNDGDKQTLWEQIAQCMGFSENTCAFRMLARLVPVSSLEHCCSIERDAMLFGASGFLPSVEISSYSKDHKNYLKMLWNYWWANSLKNESKNSLPNCWSFANVRPANHPHRRVAALSSIASVLSQILESLNESDWKQCVKILLNLSHDFFSYSYTLNSNKSSRSIGLVGRSRASQILWNCFIPWMISTGNSFIENWEQFPPEEENIKIKRAVERVFPGFRFSQLKLDGLARQGLIEILENFCDLAPNECGNCCMPEVLQRNYLS